MMTTDLTAGHLYWSEDGGFTWTLLGETRANLFPIAVLPEGGVFADFADSDQTLVFFDGTPLNEEELRVLSSRLLLPRQWNGLAKTISALDGSVMATMPFTDDVGPLLLWPGKPPVVSWWKRGVPLGESSYYFTTPLPDGSFTGVRTKPFAALHGWLDDFVIGSFDPADGTILPGMSVGLLDLQAGIVYPIGAPFGERPLVGRNFVRLAQRGPFWRVPGPDCLPLRAWPDAFASVTACAAPTVLLRPTGGVRYEHGVEWREASMPNRTTGWVPRGSVEG